MLLPSVVSGTRCSIAAIIAQLQSPGCYGNKSCAIVNRHRKAASAGVAIRSNVSGLTLDCCAKFTPDHDPGLAMMMPRLSLKLLWMLENTSLSKLLPPLRRDTLPADTAALAQFLIGKIVVRALPCGLASGRIVETEAYLAGDEASHGFRGMTARNSVLFGPPGYAYVYLNYGVYFALNVSGGAVGVGEGVLIRAAEPVMGIDTMMLHRGEVPRRDLMRGPGRLAKALNIDRSLNGTDLCEAGPLWLSGDGHDPQGFGVSTRIGISRDAHRPLRFFLKASPYVSGPASLNR